MLERILERIAKYATSKYTVLVAIMIIVVWLITGPLLQYSDLWQLVINTFTTIINFIVGFIILYTGDKNTKALHIKIDALIKALSEVDNKYAHIENKTEAEIAELDKEI